METLSDSGSEYETDDSDSNCTCSSEGTGIVEETPVSSTHTLTFKCIGSTKEESYQETYISQNNLVHDTEVLQPESDNPYDS